MFRPFILTHGRTPAQTPTTVSIFGDIDADEFMDSDDALPVGEQANAALNTVQEIQNILQATLDDEPSDEDLVQDDARALASLREGYGLLRQAKAKLNEAQKTLINATA